MLFYQISSIMMLSNSRVRFAIHMHGTDGLKVLDRLYIIRYLGARKPESCTEICFNSLTQPFTLSVLPEATL
jgi:hypothetical protein